MKAVAAALFSAALAIGPFVPGSAEELSLRGKTIGITVIGTTHHWDYMAFRGQIETLERLGGRVIAYDAQHNQETQVTHIRDLIAKRPHAIIEQLGNIEVLDPWLKRVRDAGIPLFTVDTVTEHAINNTTSNNYGIGSDLALQMVQDMGGEGKVLIFNGFYTVPVCKIRYDQLRYVMEAFPRIELIEPELRDVMTNTVRQAYIDVAEMLTKLGPDSGLKAIWACWDRPMVGATLAVEDAGRLEVRTYGVDGSPEYVEMVARPGSAAAAVAAQQPYRIGMGAALNVALYLSGEPVPPVTFVPAVMITKANAAESRGAVLAEVAGEITGPARLRLRDARVGKRAGSGRLGCRPIGTDQRGRSASVVRSVCGRFSIAHPPRSALRAPGARGESSPVRTTSSIEGAGDASPM